MNSLTRFAALAALSLVHLPGAAAPGGRPPSAAQTPAAAEVKEPVTLVSFYLSTIAQTSPVLQGAPRGQARLGRDVLTSSPSDRLNVRVRNDDPARAIREIGYQLYRKDKTRGAEVASVNLSDKVKIKPGKVSGERTLRWSADALGCGRSINECGLSVRVVRVKYEDGSEWLHPKLSGGTSQ